jgi:GTPase SAR1 family protein
MAALEKNRLVLRVAYAGAPLAGKTESIRMLLRLLRGKDGDKHIFSPGEARGRTVFFDWADYEAGTFQGNPIRCQITSVPGQAVLSARREALIRAADAVILVIDSRPEGLEEARRSYGEMSPWLANADRELEVRVVLQCNKQDLEGSVLPDLLRSKLGFPPDRTAYGTSATTGKGLRPAFIAAVREALNRARALTDKGLIRFGRPEIDSGQELLERLQRDVVATDASIAPQPPVPPARVVSEPLRAPPVATSPAPAARAPHANDVASPQGQGAIASPEAKVTAATAAPPSREAPRPAAEPGATDSPRPAVMPANAWRALMPHRGQKIIAPVVRLVDALPRATALQLVGPAAPAARSASPVVQAQPDRPTPSPIERTPSPAPPTKAPPVAPTRAPRPAVMPASAYRALNSTQPYNAPAIPQRITVTPATVTVTAAIASPVERPAATQAKTTQDETGVVVIAERAPQALSKRRMRPAIMPAAAFRAEFGEAAPARGAASTATDLSPNTEQAGDAPRLPARGLPDEQVCPVAIWRPLELQMSAGARAAADPRGGWHGEPAPGWYAHTIDSEADPAAARRLYDTSVSRQSALHRYLSKDRCLALTHDVGRWWVWQVVRKVPTLSTRFNDWPRAGDSPDASAESLLDSATSYWNALQALRQAPEGLPVAFEKVAPQDGSFVYAGLLPRAVTPPASSPEGDADFEDVLRKKLAVRPPPPIHVPAVLEELRKRATGRLSGPVLEMICSVLIGH